ncbi:MAG: CDP-glucose 4,6-dehydratase [Acidimicrobiales bacterium]|jgi:CDP-glucose 4,6-dehydratase
MDPQFWQGKRVLVTGHTGFKGSWLSLWLHSMGANVTGLSNGIPEGGSLFDDARIGELITDRRGDVRDLDAVSAALEDSDAEIVFHLAAQSLVHRSYQQPAETISTNVMGTTNVLEALRLRAVPCAAVMITSDKCYRNKEWTWGYRETDELGGRDPYSASKGAAELSIRTYSQSFLTPEEGFAVASVRAGNVVGGGDWSEFRLIPDLMRAFASGERLLIREPYALRPWQHVLEPLSAYMNVAERLVKDPDRAIGGWNVGPDIHEIRPVGWLADKLAESWGDGVGWDLDGKVYPHEDTFLRLDCTKIASRLGWRPVFGLPETLEWVTEWYKAHAADEDARTVTLAQIARYQTRRTGADAELAADTFVVPDEKITCT